MFAKKHQGSNNLTSMMGFLRNKVNHDHDKMNS